MDFHVFSVQVDSPFESLDSLSKSLLVPRGVAWYCLFGPWRNRPLFSCHLASEARNRVDLLTECGITSEIESSEVRNMDPINWELVREADSPFYKYIDPNNPSDSEEESWWLGSGLMNWAREFDDWQDGCTSQLLIRSPDPEKAAKVALFAYAISGVGIEAATKIFEILSIDQNMVFLPPSSSERGWDYLTLSFALAVCLTSGSQVAVKDWFAPYQPETTFADSAAFLAHLRAQPNVLRLSGGKASLVEDLCFSMALGM